ncbi:helicase-related protein [uncultured Oscillibacter sp.]|uniref:helicase-related protein n=1 Tax=uncultured Oscillibacter sp. TaxID=876091 RepID=UPI002803B48E|nr:helicase-related protein [uncultured Oscillibacter sp.]
MATTLQAVIGLSDKLTSDLTTRRGAWRQYLNTAARVYKYSFADQLLIYGQRPDATACAELPLWNEKMGRWVNRGAHGIALIDTSGRRPRLRYVFDVSDTHLSRDGNGRTLRLWTIRPGQHEAVSEELERMYPNAGITGMDFTEKIIKICELAVKDQLSYYLEELGRVKAGSLLEELDSQNLAMWLRLPLEASVGYTVLTRCGIDAGLYYDDVDFEKIYDFSTAATLSVLGNATSNISRTLLLELGQLARSLTRQRQPRRKPPVPVRRPTPPRQKPESTPAPTVQSDTKPGTEAAQVSVSGVMETKASESSMQEAPEETPPAEAETSSEPETMTAAEPETPETPEVSAPVEQEVSAAPEPAHYIPLGSTVYIGTKEYELLAYGGENVTLYDPDCPLFNEVMPRSEFDAKLTENPLNSHLFAADAATPESAEQVSAPERAEPGAAPEPEQAPTVQLAPPPAVRRHSKVSPTVLHPEIPAEQRHNYHIHDDALGAGTPGEKFNRNARAIRLLKKLETEDRFAAPEEQEVLAQYVGWGGLADCFDERHSKYGELKALLTEDEYAAARASTLNAHYTTPVVIRAIYDTLSNMGFKTGNILEPSCGVGNFFGCLPETMGDSKLYGVELDSLTGRIAQQLYQNASITVQGYERVNYPKDFFDVAVGNVPFGSYQVNDKAYNRLGFSIHNYFFAKALDQVRPGGIVAFVTSRYTLDSKDTTVRKYLAQRAELLGAIRLPNDAFKANAGTEVVTDIIILQKRDHIDLPEPAWVQLGESANGFAINRYFADHPEMVLGVQTSESTQYGKQDFTVAPIEGADLGEQLAGAIQHIHGVYTEAAPADVEDAEADDSIPADPAVRNYSYTVVDGKVYYRENSCMTPVRVSGTAEGRIKGLIGLRDCVRTLIEYQTEDYPDEDIQAEQRKLNARYDAFVRQYGRISSRANNSAFRADSSYFLLSSLEVLDDEGKFIRKADMFSKRTIKRHVTVTHVDTASEALALSLGERAKADMAYMTELTGKTEEEIYTDLKGVIFLNPLYAGEESNQAKYLPADEYLSGNVREKLAVAKRRAELHPDDYAVNVQALEAVQPVDLTAAEISVRLGATWLPVDVVEQFMYELMQTPRYMRANICIHYSTYTGEWQVEGKSRDKSSVNANSTYGTGRVNGYKILEETLNLRTVRVFDYIEDEHGNRVPVLNKQETAIAQGKQELIKQAFQDWVWKDQHRRDRLTRLYNEKFNSIRPREYDGSHLNFVGINPAIQLRPHQVNAIAHILYGGNTLLAHVVGAGKTYEMVAAGMESKRLGLCQKSLYVVPNHLTEQWATEFLQLYPAANILVATRKDFETKNRKRFCGRIATGDYDAIIIGHSQFEKIPMSVERQRYILERQEQDIMDGLAELKANHGERFSIKQLERSKKSIQAKLEKLNDQSRKDDVVTFEELGVDRLFVDEAHSFKNLAAFSKMRNVGGISQTEAQKSSDLYMKCRYLDELTGGRGVVFATGTPISNTMVEMYTMQKYLQYHTLEEHGLLHFDAWASTFGETVTAIELAPEGTGYRAKTRFSRFYNLPELMSMFKEVADIQTADMLNLPVPKANYHNIVLKPSEHQKQMVAALSKRAEKVRNKMVDPSVDNMLRITNDGRKLALDQRMMNPMLPASETGKVNACAENVYVIWQRTAAHRSTQMVFCDLSTPKGDGQFNIYDALRDMLTDMGIPANEIAYIHNAKTESQKKELFGKVRSGQVRVLIGSTQKMGAGTNVQQRLIALHHLDCPWRPADLQQREGRIIRQGNENDEVDIYTYVTENTFDSYLYQMVEDKQKFIGQIMTSKSPIRSAEDIDETALSYAEIKALCTGNPLIKERMDLDIDVQRLRLLKANFLSQKYALEDKIAKYLPQEIREHEQSVAGYEADIAHLAANTHPNADGFSPMVVENKGYTTKKAAGSAILEACQAMTSPDPVPLGAYRGFAMVVRFDSISREYRVTLSNKMSYTTALGTDLYGNIARLDNALAGIEAQRAAAREELENAKQQLATAREQVNRPFPQEDELKAKSARLDELNIALNLDKRDNEDMDGGEELPKAG